MADPITCPDCGRPRSPDACNGVMNCMNSMRDQLAASRQLIAATRAQLDRARLLLIKCRDGLDLAINETSQEVDGG